MWRYGPPIVWAALIFIGSSQLLAGSNTSPFLLGLLRKLFPQASAETLGTVNLAIRKFAHFAEYAILAWLVARALTTSSRQFIRRRWFWLSLILVVVYSLSDEFHQSFVPSRGASIYDSMIDSAGGLAALIVVWLWQRRRLKRANPGSSVGV